MCRRVAAVCLLLSACGGGGGTPAAVAASEFCGELVEAVCDREADCGTFADRPTCVATVTDAFDACPLNINAVAMQEADYDEAEAARLLTTVRGDGCGGDLPDVVTEIPVFTPKLSEGAVCHSDISCTTGLTCSDLTISNPQGVCASL